MAGEALSFGGVAERYDRARPSYPREAASWLVGSTGRGDPTRVVELGSGTGKLTEQLTALGHRVLATDPDERMLRHLTKRASEAHACAARAEAIPAASRSVDVLVAAQCFHWFDLDHAVPEFARVLRPGGVLALVWNFRDESIPWVRKLGRLIGTQEHDFDPVLALGRYTAFGYVEERGFRHWQTYDRDSLLDLVASRSNVATLGEEERDYRLEQVSALYDDYGRGHDGMRLPYVTRCYRTVVQEQPDLPEPTDQHQREAEPKPPPEPEDPGTLLIDFR